MLTRGPLPRTRPGRLLFGRRGLLFCVLVLALSLYAWYAPLPSLLRAPPSGVLTLLIAYESVPHGNDGAEKYLASTVRALAALPRVRPIFLARSTVDKCRALPSDSEALGAVAIREAGPHSPEFHRLLRQPSTALLLPLSFFEGCSGHNASSSEVYSAALRSLQAASGAYSAVPLAVFAFDAQAYRLQGLAANEPHAEQAARFTEAARLERAREEALYARADVFAMLTPEDLAVAPATPPGVPRLAVSFRDADIDPRLRSTPGGSAVPSALARAELVRAALPGFAARSGFVFLGGGNNPTNVLALYYFVKRVWPAIRARLPSATLSIVGSPPTRLCKAHGIWCGWLEGTAFQGQAPSESGILVHGLVEDPRTVLSGARVALAPLVCGTGINTKTGFYMSQGLPVVGTEKGFRGYGQQPTPGFAVHPLDAEGEQGGEAMAEAAVALHENREAWERAATAALVRTAELEDERAKAADLEALVQALRSALIDRSR